MILEAALSAVEATNSEQSEGLSQATQTLSPVCIYIKSYLYALKIRKAVRQRPL